ncbi:F-box family protein [Klebsormidium nitens]|uniref:F-box family protein n=1 Tax=Klebsormidium nitens TaxID=105231 RepID=A0A1Y1IQ26_KLENI|nr:F-box family protein [Klebsormidium nitens]|eukprot:GAQ91331.1 F-box family protein [Klebsormidium nitens]
MATMKRNTGTVTVEDLGQELLASIFLKLGPSPMHLVALACVCKRWRQVMEGDLWRQLCLEAAPALCNSLLYSVTSASPPGGWLGVYKLLLYCPGLETSANWERAERLAGVYEDILGHMHETASGFQTGPQVNKDLGLMAQFASDVLFVSSPCSHEMRSQRCGSIGLLGMVFRGVVQRFEHSAIARRLGAVAYLNAPGYAQKQLQKMATDLCAYCQAPLVMLPPAIFDNPICDTEPVPRDGKFNFQLTKGNGVNVSGHCCLNGHLIGVYQGWDGGQLLHREKFPGSGAGLSVQTCRIGRVLSSALLPNPENCSCDTAVKKSLDAFSASRRIKRLLDRIDKEGGESELSRVQEWWPAGETQVEYEIRRRQEILDTELEWIEKLFKADLARFPESELDLDIGDETPFWSIDGKDLQRIKTFLDSVPYSEGVFLEYLKHREHTTSITLERIRRMRLYNLKEQELEEARKKLIETALAALGVRVTTRGRLLGQWPDPLSVERYIKLGDVSVYEVVMCQKRELQDRKLAAAARQKANKEAREKVKENGKTTRSSK